MKIKKTVLSLLLIGLLSFGLVGVTSVSASAASSRHHVTITEYDTPL